MWSQLEKVQGSQRLGFRIQYLCALGAVEAAVDLYECSSPVGSPVLITTITPSELHTLATVMWALINGCRSRRAVQLFYSRVLMTTSPGPLDIAELVVVPLLHALAHVIHEDTTLTVAEGDTRCELGCVN